MGDPAVTIQARGHPNVRAQHGKTLELTADSAITQAGTCIVGVSTTYDADRLATLRGRVQIVLRCGTVTEHLTATMNPLYLPGDPLILRKSDRPQRRTLTIGTSHGAVDLDRELIDALKQADATLEMIIREVGRDDTPGVLYLVGVPLGDDDDLTPRAIRVLQAADLVACEDTRTSRPLLDRIGATKNRISYHDHNERERIDELETVLRSGGRVAVVSDAGMPGIADPGHHITRAAHAIGALVSPVAGPSAALLAVVASGLPTDTFMFGGFLPRTPKNRRTSLERFHAAPTTTVIYEAPHRLAATLEDIESIFGDRPIAVARELTKQNEEICVGSARTILDELTAGDRVRGEITIVLSGAPMKTAVDDDVPAWLEPMCRALLADGVSTSTIAGAIRAATGWPKKRGYRFVVELSA